MGLHTGEAQLRDEVRYFGQAVARTARLRDLGHTGQVLVSRETADLVAEHLPAGASLDDLGTHRMADLSRPGSGLPVVPPRPRRRLPASAVPGPPPPQPGRAADQLRRPGGGRGRAGRAAGRPRPGHPHRLGRLRQDPPGPAGSGRGPGGPGRRGVVRGPVGVGRPQSRPRRRHGRHRRPRGTRPEPHRDAHGPAGGAGRSHRAGQLRARAVRCLLPGRGAGARLWAPGAAGHLTPTSGGGRRGDLAGPLPLSARGTGRARHRLPGRLRGGPALRGPAGRPAELRRDR